MTIDALVMAMEKELFAKSRISGYHIFDHLISASHMKKSGYYLPRNIFPEISHRILWRRKPKKFT